MEKGNKRKAKAVALATAAVLALAGTIAYLADASGIIRNQWDPNHVEVDIAESGIDKDDGTKDYSIIPGATDEKDPHITVDTDTDAFVFAAVKDNINNIDGTKYVDYEIADGWTLLEPGDPSDMISQTITKYLNTFASHKTEGTIEIDPNDTNTKIYYRVVHGTNANHEFGPFSVLKNDQVHYPSTLTNADLDKLTTLGEDQKQLTFATYAIQMDPFCDPAETDTDKLEAGAKDAWNQVEKVSKITVTAAGDATEVGEGKTLQMIATVLPENAKDKTYTWSVEPGTGTATITDEGVLTGETAGTVTVVATANDGSGVKGTYEVTVVEATFGYAVQLHSTDGGTITFWPAMGVNAVDQGVTCGSAHCIHNDSFEEIKAHPENYAQCISNGCTKKVLIDESKFVNPIFRDAIRTTGDGGGLLIDGLSDSELRWSTSHNPDEPTYRTTLEKIRDYSSIPDEAEIYLLDKDELIASKPNASDRVTYSNAGTADQWWLRNPMEPKQYNNYDNFVVGVSHTGEIIDVGNYGSSWWCCIAPGFSY